MQFNKKWWLAVIPVVLLIAFVFYFSDIVTYLILGWVVSMAGSPIRHFFDRFMNVNLSTALTLVIIIFMFVGIIALLVPPLIQQANNLTKVNYENVIESLEEPIESWENWLKDKGILQEEVSQVSVKEDIEEDNIQFSKSQIIEIDSVFNAQDSSYITYPKIALVVNIDNDIHNNEAPLANEETSSLVGLMKEKVFTFLNPNRVLGVVNSIFSFSTNLLVTLMSVLFVAFFFLKENGLFKNMLSSFVPDSYETSALKAFDDSKELLMRYFLGIVIQISIVTLLVWIALSLLGIKSALLIAVFAALMNVIPYLGPILGAAIGGLVVICSNLDASFFAVTFPQLIKIGAVFGCMQFIDNFLLQPNIFSKSVKAHPLEIFIVILIGAKLGGVLGMVIAIPTYTVFRVLGKVFLSEFKIVQALTKGV